MAALERLFRLEIAFHERMRAAGELAEAAPAHTSFALQNGYEGLLRGIGKTSGADIDRLMARLAMMGDPRDVLAARDAVNQLLGIPCNET